MSPIVTEISSSLRDPYVHILDDSTIGNIWDYSLYDTHFVILHRIPEYNKKYAN